MSNKQLEYAPAITVNVGTLALSESSTNRFDLNNPLYQFRWTLSLGIAVLPISFTRIADWVFYAMQGSDLDLGNAGLLESMFFIPEQFRPTQNAVVLPWFGQANPTVPGIEVIRATIYTSGNLEFSLANGTEFSSGPVACGPIQGSGCYYVGTI